jgi:hypothetical protein
MLGIDSADAIDNGRILIFDVRGKSFNIRGLDARGLRRRDRTGLQQRRQGRVGIAAGEFGNHRRSKSCHEPVQHPGLLLAIPVGE